MPALAESLAQRDDAVFESSGSAASVSARAVADGVAALAALAKRINVPSNSSSSPPGLVAANTRDPWNKSGKYGLGIVYFCIPLLVLAALVRYYHLFTEVVRIGLRQEEVQQASTTSSPDTDYELSVFTDKSTNKFFPRTGPVPPPPKTQSSLGPVNQCIALFRFLFYRPIPELRYRKGWRPVAFPSVGVCVIVGAAFVFTTLYCFVPRPLYWASIADGSPPLAIRAGMLAVALMPWIVGLSMKANVLSLVTGIGHERLNVLHRWGAYLCLFLSLVHTIPFYVTPIWDDGGRTVFQSFFPQSGFYPYGTGVAALVPLAFLCVHSLAPLRHWMYELFVALHVPVAIVFLAMLFWHCHNYLTSWNYLYATVAIWLSSYAMRVFYLNWTNPFRLSWLIGDEAAVSILAENAIKITIPTQMRWKPGQYVYLRMPGISVFESHPFTVASLCSDDFPSAYGEGYRDMVVVFRPFGGFTNKVLRSAVKHGPWHTYRAFLDGPYGGMRRRIEAFDQVVLIAGGSGITAVVSQLLSLIKKMRDGKAVTKDVHVLWALKRPGTMDWFKEELRICREHAPPAAVRCRFYITAAKRMQAAAAAAAGARTPTRPVSVFLHDKVNGAIQNIADYRLSGASNRFSALIRDEAGGDAERERALRRENEDAISALPQAHLVSVNRSQSSLPAAGRTSRRQNRNLSVDVEQAAVAGPADAAQGGFDFGFPSTPTEFQKNLMRFAFLPAVVPQQGGWSTEYGRPDLPFTLRSLVGAAGVGRRTCVFVCGPPSMRVDVSRAVAQVQAGVVRGGGVDEVYLHAENYAL